MSALRDRTRCRRRGCSCRLRCRRPSAELQNLLGAHSYLTHSQKRSRKRIRQQEQAPQRCQLPEAARQRGELVAGPVGRARDATDSSLPNFHSAMYVPQGQKSVIHCAYDIFDAVYTVYACNTSLNLTLQCIRTEYNTTLITSNHVESNEIKYTVRTL